MESTKIYIEHGKEFYDLSAFGFENARMIANSTGIDERYRTNKRDFEIGARVRFEGTGWTEFVEKNGCGGCVFSRLDNEGYHCSKKIKKFEGGVSCKDIVFKKLDITEKQPEGPAESEPEKSAYYILNEKTYYTKFAHTTESEARKEAERLATKQPGDSFKVLKVVAECTGKVEIEWK